MGDKALVQSPTSSRPTLMNRADLESVWDGRLILMTRRASLSDLSRRFDITWFVSALHKYRHIFARVLVASFFLQLFALVTPLFFQVVIDKVLVHRSLGTLDVLVVGLVAISLFETILGILRTYVFSLTPRTALMSNWEPGYSGICWRYPSHIFRRAGWAIR